MPCDEATLRKFQRELNAGTVALVLLGLLERATRPMYGYQIAKRLEGAAKGSLAMKQGTLYPVLRSLEALGLAASEVEPSVAGPPRRYYAITGAGREMLGCWRETWRDTRDFVDAVLDGGPLTPGQDEGDAATAGAPTHDGLDLAGGSHA